MRITIRNRVREMRNLKQLTQSDLAKAVDVTRQTIISLEKGSYIPSLLLAMRISKVLCVKIEDIFYLEEEKY